MPWPAFDGWDEALPAHLGQPDSDCGGYVLIDVVATVAFLRGRCEWEKVGIWRDIATAIDGRSQRRG